jgi:hypothetical protein
VVRPQVDRSADCLLQLALHRGESEKIRGTARFELHEYVYVAVLSEVASQHRAEERQPRDAMPAGERREHGIGDMQAWTQLHDVMIADIRSRQGHAMPIRLPLALKIVDSER